MKAIGLDNLPLIKEGDDLVGIIIRGTSDKGIALNDRDIVVVTEKIVSKAEGQLVMLDSVVPSEEARRLAKNTGKDSRIVELILRESKELLCADKFILAETRHGFICANAGIDQSNIEKGFAKLLPENPDASAEKLRKGIEAKSGKCIGVVISDSWGRPFRTGSVGVAIGASGIKALWDRRGEVDLFGRTLESTRVALGDCLASAASLITGEAGEQIPVVIIKGVDFAGDGSAKDLLREKEEDVFR